MRFVKLFFALLAGLVVAAAVAIAGLFIFLVHRLFGRTRQRIPAAGRAAQPAGGEVIEVTATEVPSDRLR